VNEFIYIYIVVLPNQLFLKVDLVVLLSSSVDNFALCVIACCSHIMYIPSGSNFCSLLSGIKSLNVIHVYEFVAKNKSTVH